MLPALASGQRQACGLSLLITGLAPPHGTDLARAFGPKLVARGELDLADMAAALARDPDAE